METVNQIFDKIMELAKDANGKYSAKRVVSMSLIATALYLLISNKQTMQSELNSIFVAFGLIICGMVVLWFTKFEWTGEQDKIDEGND